jgi:hypothetical protein
VIPLTLRHVYDFGADRPQVGADLVRPEAWDALRTQTSGAFALAADRAQLEATVAAHPELTARARAIAAWAQDAGVQRLASYGVGGGSLELALAQVAPGLSLQTTDFGPQTVARLRALLPETRPVEHDLRRDGPLDADAHLLHRVDTELDNRQWRALLARFADRRVLVVATEVIGLRRASWELRIRLARRDATRAGWIRNRAAFERLWRPTHRATALTIGDLYAWDLRPGNAERTRDATSTARVRAT